MRLANMLGAAAALMEAALDAIVPPKERTVRVTSRRGEPLPVAPRSHTIGSVTIVTLTEYRVPAVADAIRALKYDGNRHAARLLADMLAEYLREEIVAAHAFSPRPVLIAPVPLHASRRRERGFNQIEQVLDRLPAELRKGPLSRVLPRALCRVRATPAQTRLSKKERLMNVRGAFDADRALVRAARVYLIDDVSTTGATLQAAAEALERAGAEVVAIALSHA